MKYQQGDVTIEKVESIPAEAVNVPVTGRRHILAEGEVTGHAHAVLDSPGVSTFKLGEDLYLRNQEEVTVTHEEHKPVTVPPGTYKIGQVREYDYLTQMTRTVRD